MAQCMKCQNDIKAIVKIQCRGCNCFVCAKCSDLSATELKVFDLKTPSLKYLCTECEKGLLAVPTMRKEIEILTKLCPS